MEINNDYWIGYSNNDDIQYSKKSTNLETTFNTAVREWNMNADDHNKLNIHQIQTIKKLAAKFFEGENWISINIIHAMICQEV